MTHPLQNLLAFSLFRVLENFERSHLLRKEELHTYLNAKESHSF